MEDRIEKELEELQARIIMVNNSGTEWQRINNRIYFLKGWLACHRGEAV